MKKIYTIGYWNRSLEDFLEVIKFHGIKTVVDVRRFPTSKKEDFCKEKLRQVLKRHGVEYLHLEKLGGYRGGYREYTQSERFEEGLSELVDVAKRSTAVIMCLEENPRGCHRKYIAAALQKKGWEVYHILKDNSTTTSLPPKRR